MLPFPAPKFINIINHFMKCNVFSLRKAHKLMLPETPPLVFWCLRQFQNISMKDEDLPKLLFVQSFSSSWYKFLSIFQAAVYNWWLIPHFFNFLQSNSSIYFGKHRACLAILQPTESMCKSTHFTCQSSWVPAKGQIPSNSNSNTAWIYLSLCLSFKWIPLVEESYFFVPLLFTSGRFLKAQLGLKFFLIHFSIFLCAILVILLVFAMFL